MGLCNATATFQRLMNMIFSTESNELGNLFLCYVDDVLVATKTIDQHLDRLAVVFEKLQGAGLKLKPKKCKLLHDSIKYLGRIIDKEGCRPDPESVEVVRTWKAPKDLRTLRSFLGFANYYREFIKDYATRIQPLQILVRNKDDWIWEEKHQECFEAMKETLIKAPVLGLPQEDGLFTLDTDASLVAIAAVLSQQQM